MLVLAYRSLLPNTSLPIDQRWRTLELDPEVFQGIDLEAPNAVANCIRRINDREVSPHVEPIPHDSEVFLMSTDDVARWELELTVKKS